MKKIRFIPLLFILSTFLTGCNVLRYDSYDYSDQYTLINDSIAFSEEQLNVEKIDFDWGKGDVEVKVVDEGTLSFSETSNKDLKDNTKARYFISNKTLFIKYAASKVTYDNKLSKKAVITINQDLASLAAANYSFSVALGDLSVDSLKTNSLYLGVAYGNINTKDITADSVRSLTDCGYQKHENITLNKLGEFKANYGDLDIITSDLVVGFSLETNVVSGSLFINTTKFPKESETFYGTHKEEDLKISIIENYGDVNLL